MNMINYIKKKIAKKKAKYQQRNFTAAKKQFANDLTYFIPNTPNENTGIVLIQLVKDYEYLVKLLATAKAIAEDKNLKINFYDVSWTAHIGWGKFRKKTSFFKSKPVLEKVIGKLNSEVIFYCEDLFENQNLIKSKLTEILKNLNSPEDLLKLKFESIDVGDLIYDTYLRYFHQVDVKEINNEIEKIIEIALNIYYNFKETLSKHPIKALVNTYTTYIEHGITARICLEEGIDVYTVGSFSYRIQKITKDFPYHQINHTLFSPNKDIKSAQLKTAENIITSRFTGKIDAATSYMRESAFKIQALNEDVKKLFEINKRNIIIYPHCFYDSQHINRQLLYPNLYQYLEQLLQNLISIENTSVFIKPHPNGIEGTKEKTIDLVKSFNVSHFHILDETVSNNNIIDLKPDLICTYRGTVGLEMAYFNIPTVALNDNMYVNFNFVHTCNSIEEYYAIVKGEKETSINFDKNQIYSFYYQAYLDKLATFDDTEIMKLLHSFNGATYNDNYLTHLKSNNFNYSELFASYLNGYNLTKN